VAKYVLLFSVTSDTLRQFIENPEDRRAPVSKLAELAGAKLESYYWMFGQYDGLAIFEIPDSATAAALALAATSTGAFSHVETHELIAADDLVGVLQKAKTLRPGYRPPGRTGG
jgi:uncharacterized protein with GYD domain